MAGNKYSVPMAWQPKARGRLSSAHRDNVTFTQVADPLTWAER